MRILAVGDIVGESGVRKLKEELPRIKREENIDFVITNGENSAKYVKCRNKCSNNGKSYMGKERHI